MKIVCISDTHNRISKVDIPDGDVLIHAGDATGRGTFQEVGRFSKEFRSLPHKYKIFVPGNHDWMFQMDEKMARELMHDGDDGLEVLIDQATIINGVKIWGSPWQPTFYNWAFNLDRGPNIAAKWDLIPEDSDIVVTHGPPKGQCDLTPYGMLNVGCEDLMNRLMVVKPEYHIFGHIHYAYGMAAAHGITFINASVCSEEYEAVNKPFVIEVEEKQDG